MGWIFYFGGLKKYFRIHTIIFWDCVLYLQKQNKTNMEQTSTLDLLVLHAYGETNLEQREFLANELSENENLQEELMELVDTQHQLNSMIKSPSETSVRIIMEHSYKTEQLQEI